MIDLGLPAIAALLLIAAYIYGHYRISRRMGFAQGASALIAFSSLFGIAFFIWWLLDWPNEKGLGDR